jgi:hypothetical protein
MYNFEQRNGNRCVYPKVQSWSDIKIRKMSALPPRTQRGSKIPPYTRKLGELLPHFLNRKIYFTTPVISGFQR